MELEGVGKIESGMDKGVVWEKNLMLGARIKSGTERAQALREGTFNAAARTLARILSQGGDDGHRRPSTASSATKWF